MKKLFAVILLCLWCRVGYSQNYEALKQLQPTLWEMLNNSTARIEKIEGNEADLARYRLTIALAKSGNFTATQRLALRLNDTGYASSVWSTVGQMQGAMQHDRATANESFARAVEAARLKKAGSSAQRSAYSEIVTVQARSGDIKGALLFAQGLDPQARQTSLTRLAQIAAQQGIEEPAIALLDVASDETEKSQAQALRALAVATREGDGPAGRDALSKITVPLHKIAVLLKLFDKPLNRIQGDADLLNEALAAVDLNKSAPSAFGFEETQNDAARGAIALRLLQTGTDRKAAIKRAMSILQEIKSPDNAQKYIDLFCARLALEDLLAAREVAQRLKGEQSIKALSAIACALGRRLSTEPKPELRKTVEDIVNQALATANELNENDRYWAGIPIAHALAEAGEFSAAYQVANSIGHANQRAYAYAGIVRSAMENRRTEQAQEALKQLEATALTEEQPEIAAQIIGQATLSIIEPLLGEDPIDIASLMVGLN